MLQMFLSSKRGTKNNEEVSTDTKEVKTLHHCSSVHHSKQDGPDWSFYLPLSL